MNEPEIWTITGCQNTQFSIINDGISTSNKNTWDLIKGLVLPKLA